LLKLTAVDGQRIQKLRRASGSAHLIHKSMLERPIASPNWIKNKILLASATVNACLRDLDNIGIIKEVTKQKRNRLYAYDQYIEIMNKGTELPK
jgi:Fic family protein